MKEIMCVVFFIVILMAACIPSNTNTPDVQNTAIAVVSTEFALTQLAQPTATLLPSTFTPTATTIHPTPSPFPTLQPPPVFTPDATQVERWQEYQTELIKAVLSGYDPVLYDSALCEWDILGRSDQEVYVWALCATLGGGNASLPAVISLSTAGSVQNVEVPEINNSTWDSQILKMFPADVREKFGLYTGDSLFLGRIKEMINHIQYRETHPEEPPLIVLSATPSP
jgi:hypothetical protein